MMHPALGILIAFGCYETVIQVNQYKERYDYWNWSRNYCDATGKQLLRIGVRRSHFEPPNGDVTLDIDPVINTIPGGVEGDERDMPFADKEFGVCFNEHTLEHLYSSEDVQLAVNECVRVADYAVFLAPSPYRIWDRFFSPTHRLLLWFDKENNVIRVKPNKDLIDLGLPISPAIRQAMVCKDDPPRILRGRMA